MDKKIKEVQHTLVDQGLGGWLLYDFRGSNSLARSFLNIPSNKLISRRFFYWIPQTGEPIKIVSKLEPHTLDHLPGQKWEYQTWQELEKYLFTLGATGSRIAMEYSPYNTIPVISKVDAGTIELMRKSGAEVVSSANILQRYTSVLSESQLESHLYAARVLDQIVDETWAYIEQALQNRIPIDEYAVQQFILKRIHDNDCMTDHEPNCSVNANSADPHYHPVKNDCLAISQGDFILIDLWCKRNSPGSIFGDITRVAVAAPEPTDRQKHIFEVVKKARDAATDFIKSRFRHKIPVQGWEVDQVSRDVIVQAGFGDYFIHRTGHNIGEELHGPGANLDNFETHDFRELLPGTCFSVEPGIYIPGEFGVRMEYDVYVDPAGEVIVTGGIQENLVCLNTKSTG